MTTNTSFPRRRHFYPGREVSLRLELLEEGGEEEGGEEEDDGPEEDVRDVGSVVTAGRARELPVEQVTHLGHRGHRLHYFYTH